MNSNIQHLKHCLLPGVYFIATVLVAIFAQQSRDWLLPVLFLLLPFADFLWQMPRIEWKTRLLISWVLLVITIVVLLFKNPDVLDVFTMMVLLAALPEEWFFRAYFMQRMESILAGQWRANIATSLFFAMLHFPMQGWFGLTVFMPSMLFGYLYQRQKDLVLVVLLHALSNIVYLSYLVEYIPY